MQKASIRFHGQRHPKKAIERMNNERHPKKAKKWKGGGLRVKFYHFIKPKYHKSRRRGYQYMIVYIDHSIYKAKFHLVVIKFR